MSFRTPSHAATEARRAALRKALAGEAERRRIEAGEALARAEQAIRDNNRN